MSEKINKLQKSQMVCPAGTTRTANTSSSKIFNYSLSSNKFIPDTTLVKNAKFYVNRVWEDTNSHYQFLKKLGKENADHYRPYAWCALTVSILSKEAGMNIGAEFIPTVDGFVEWAGRRYKKIPMNKLNNTNIKQERENRAGYILSQIKSNKMKEGDFIIWKGDTATRKGQNWDVHNASHIGIIERVDPQKGTITVIEGNANITKYGKNGEALIVKTKEQGINGNQGIGEAQEVNRHDGLIRKTYTITELAKNGYSGYIDNSGIVK